MTHNLNTQYFSFEGKTFKKGVSSYAYVDALFILQNANLVKISYVDDNAKIVHHQDVTIKQAKQHITNHSNRILVNKRGTALGCIIYLGVNDERLGLTNDS